MITFKCLSYKVYIIPVLADSLRLSQQESFLLDSINKRALKTSSLTYFKLKENAYYSFTSSSHGCSPSGKHHSWLFQTLSLTAVGR